MKLFFKQHTFTWGGRFEVVDEAGKLVFTAKGSAGLRHRIKVFDAQGKFLGMLQEKMMMSSCMFELWLGAKQCGRLYRKPRYGRTQYILECANWQVRGDMLNAKFTVTDAKGEEVARISKQLWKNTDLYTIELKEQKDALFAVLFTLAVDAEKDWMRYLPLYFLSMGVR